MSESDNTDRFRSVRGFLSGSEPNEELYYAHSASLRVFGTIPDLDEITRRLGVLPTSSHRHGERRGPTSKPYPSDMCCYCAPVDENERLRVHIDTLWNTFREHKQYLLELKQNLTVDVFLGYRTNDGTAGVEVPFQSLEIFTELQCPFSLSIILA